MALTLPGPVTGVFDAATRDQASLFKKLAHAVLGAGTTAQSITAQNELLGRPDFRARAKTTDNAAASQVIDLTDEGVTFPAATLRKVKFRSKAVSDNDTYLQEWEQYVWGNDGTTPKLVGTARLLNAIGIINGTVVQYGNCTARATYSTDTATADTDDSSAGSSLGNNATNTITLTHPIARTSPKRVTGINNCPAAATASGARWVGAVSATATTFSIFVTDLATPTAASPAANLDVSFFILPPPSVALVMNSNNVELHCGHDATDDVYHNVEVFVGPTETNALVAD